MRVYYSFDGTKLTEIEPPDWLSAAHDGDERDTAFSNAGITECDCIGDDDTDQIRIFRAPNDSWMVEFWDFDTFYATVILDDPGAYITFRAIYLAPIANLIKLRAVTEPR